MIRRITEVRETTIYVGDKLIVVKEEVHTIRILPDTPED